MRKNLPQILTVIKYTYSLVFILVVFMQFHSLKLLLIQGMELVSIFLVCDFLAGKNRVIASVLSFLACFFFNAQLAVLFFGNSYLSMIMLSNITLIGDLAGKAHIYIPNVIVLVICSALPVTHIKLLDKIPLPSRVVYTMPVVCWLGAGIIFGLNNSPYGSYAILARDSYRMYRMNADIARNKEMVEEVFGTESNGSEKDKNDWGSTSEFYKPGINSGWDEEVFSGKPNVIFIMAEGLSQSIVDDPRDLMLNLREYEGKSINFTNYYDHSIATYRGIIGQLYSGYQFENPEENRLIGIQDVFEDEGYKSIYINTEPNMDEFIDYVNQLGFDEVVSEPGFVYEGEALALSDKEAFLRLEAKMEEEHESGKPYFITMYTFGTHATLGSPHEHYGNGNDRMLDKFYNLDHWFGEFMDWFNNAGEVTDNTLLIFSADHATYIDNDWLAAFPDDPRENLWIDPVPCLFYYKGVTPKTIDVSGKNTINIAPTILDFVNVGEEHSNFFLGESLFLEEDEVEENPFGSVFYSKDFPGLVDTAGGNLREFSEKEEEDFMRIVNRYLALKNMAPKR